MSEYQYYEFLAIDRPLTKREMGELRSISTRAEITAARFFNEYHWGDLKADPKELVARYFDAHLYFANWGSRRFMLRLPAESVEESALIPYFAGESARLTRSKGFVVLDFWSDDEDSRYEDFLDGHDLAALIPVRAQLLQGDLRPAYVAWLGSVQAGEIDEDEYEPPVPAGLSTSSAALASLIDFLRVDPDLFAAAAEASAAEVDDGQQLRAWVKALPVSEKNSWLLRATDQPDMALGRAILATFRRAHPAAMADAPRTVAELRERAGQLGAERTAKEERAHARARKAAERARAKRLDGLAARWDVAWEDLAKLVDSRAYDQAVALAIDLRDLSVRDDRGPDFEARFGALKKVHGRRRGFFDAFKRTSQNPP